MTMDAYELWKAAMYGVGVFVMCNVGGQILMRLAMGRKAARKELPVRVGVVRTPDGRQWTGKDNGEPFAVVRGMEIVKERGGQSFEEMRRQVDAGRTDAARTETDAAPMGDMSPDADAAQSGAEAVSGKRQPERFAPLSPSLASARQSWFMHWERVVGDTFPESSLGALTEDFRTYADKYGGVAVVALVADAIRDNLTLIPWEKLETAKA